MEINNRIVELRQKALSATMNPHFVFNSLTAMQYYINHNEKTKSSEYIAKLSRLVRMFLNQSSEPFISLQEEIVRLKLYVDFELLRFQNFEFKIIEQGYTDASKIMMPNMILQPFVENSILHGVSHLKEKDGKVIITIKLESDVLHITIEDNGFGLDPSGSNSSHISKGISIITERLDIMQKKYPEKTYTIIQKPVDPNKERKGHCVYLTISV